MTTETPWKLCSSPACPAPESRRAERAGRCRLLLRGQPAPRVAAAVCRAGAASTMPTGVSPLPLTCAVPHPAAWCLQTAARAFDANWVMVVKRTVSGRQHRYAGAPFLGNPAQAPTCRRIDTHRKRRRNSGSPTAHLWMPLNWNATCWLTFAKEAHVIDTSMFAPGAVAGLCERR